MMGWHGVMVTVVPASPHSALMQLNKTTLFALPGRPTYLEQHRDTFITAVHLLLTSS